MYGGGCHRRRRPFCIGGSADVVRGNHAEETGHWAPWTSGGIRRHVMREMTPVISSTGSCYVTPGKHRLLQHFRASPVSIAWHDPEAERSSPDSCEGGSEEKICPRIGQSVTAMGQDKAILILFALSREDVSLMSGIRPSFWALPVMLGNNA
jgi:hypothetical protein